MSRDLYVRVELKGKREVGRGRRKFKLRKGGRLASV